MNLELKESMSFPAMTQTLSSKLPNYQVELKKNSLLGFEYIQVKKTGFVGVWVRKFDKKSRVTLIKTIPSNMFRGLLGLIPLLFVSGAQSRLRNEVATVLKQEFNTSAQV